MRDTILFDLDGTLLPLNMDEFLSLYFQEMGKAFRDLIEPELLVKYIWAGTGAMIQSLEKKTNEEVFMDAFSRLIAGDLKVYQERFDRFYDEGFLETQKAVKASPQMKETVRLLKQKGYTLAIATNPIFPQKAIYHRIHWAGLDPWDFQYISCYEENCFCKPNPEFYQEVLETLKKRPDQCFMVGNDVQEDMVAGLIGMETYLITEYLIDRGDSELPIHHRGSYDDFRLFAASLPELIAEKGSSLRTL